MTFVRWHYRSGVYVCSHHRRTRRQVCERQIPLLPAALPHTPLRTGGRALPPSDDPLPLAPVPGQARLPLGA